MRRKLLFLYFLLPITGLSQVWKVLGNGGDNTVGQGILTSIIHNDKLWVGGTFDSVDGGGLYSFRLAAWDSASWQPSSALINGPIYSLATYNSNICIGGIFTHVDLNFYCENIAARNGNNWEPLGKGINNGMVLTLAEYNGYLYAGGTFTIVDSIISAYKIARWNGSNWKAIGSGISGGLPTIYAMAVYNNELIIAGEFGMVDSFPANCIARFNGSSWDSLSSGINGFVRCLLVDSVNNLLYVGGNISSAGGIATPSGVAVWDGNNWSAVGGGPFLSPVAMAIYQSKLFAGGSQNNIISPVGDTIRQVAWYDGIHWRPACYQLDGGEVGAMNVFKDELYIAGHFDVIDNIMVYKIARTFISPTHLYELENEDLFYLTPNPASKKLLIENLSHVKGKWNVYDESGKICKSGLIYAIDTSIEIALDNLKEGKYYFEFESQDSRRFAKPFIIAGK